MGDKAADDIFEAGGPDVGMSEDEGQELSDTDTQTLAKSYAAILAPNVQQPGSIQYQALHSPSLPPARSRFASGRRKNAIIFTDLQTTARKCNRGSCPLYKISLHICALARVQRVTSVYHEFRFNKTQL